MTRPGGTVVLSWTTWFSPVGRSRDRALALRRRTGSRGPLRPPTRPPARRTTSARACMPSMPARCSPGPAATGQPSSSLPTRATTRRGAVGRPGAGRARGRRLEPRPRPHGALTWRRRRRHSSRLPAAWSGSPSTAVSGGSARGVACRSSPSRSTPTRASSSPTPSSTSPSGPRRLLGRALHLWDPLGSAGQLQNQALRLPVPDGAVLRASRHAMRVPGWVTQRLWWALLLIVVVCRLGRTDPAAADRHPSGPGSWPASGSPSRPMSSRCSAGLGRGVAAGAGSVGARPLVGAGGAARRPRRAAALSGLAVLAMGGVNAAVDLAAVLPAGGVAADPALGRSPAAPRRLVGALRSRSDAVVGGPAARSRPVQPAVPRLHRVGGGDDRARPRSSRCCGAPRTGWPSSATA